MKKCEKFDEWTECEKRGCQGCFHNKKDDYFILKFAEYKYIIDRIKNKCKTEIEVSRNGMYIFRDNIVMKRKYETQYIIYKELLENFLKEVEE